MVCQEALCAAMPTSTPRRDPPWAAGLRAARANLVPGLIVQGVMLALLLAYYFYPPTHDLLDQLALIKERWGYGYSAVAAVIAGAVIPELMRIFVFQHFRIRSSNFTNLLFSIPFWCIMGVVVDFFYQQQALWFGAEATFHVVWKKVLVDQFLYNPLFAAPVTAWLYDWKNSGYRTTGNSRFFTIRYYQETVFATLFATWGVWIPVVTILYSLPSLLQIPLFALALSLWVMLYTWMSEHRAKEPR
jgi:hypothetical protein